jgi:hypothetical protein
MPLIVQRRLPVLLASDAPEAGTPSTEEVIRATREERDATFDRILDLR